MGPPVHLQVHVSPRQDRVVRGLVRLIQEVELGAKEALSPAQRHAVHGPQRQGRGDRQFGVLLRGSASARGRGSPGSECCWRDPHGDVAELNMGLVVLDPIGNAILGLVLRMDSGAHLGVVGHSGA